MTRCEKVLKLGNAIRDYRGAYHPRSKDWIRPPKLHAISRVRTWLERLNLDANDLLVKINAFKTYDEMRAWISTL